MPHSSEPCEIARLAVVQWTFYRLFTSSSSAWPWEMNWLACCSLMDWPLKAALSSSVIRPGSAVDACLIHTGPDHAQPGGSDVRLHITVVPGETRLFRDTRRITVSRTREQEVIRIGEHS